MSKIQDEDPTDRPDAQEPELPSPPQTRTLLLGARRGDAEARQRLFGHLYEALQRLARGQRRRSPSSALQTTELVHEAYLKLCRAERLSPADRSHFFAIAASAMRQVLVDHHRRASAGKRGAGAAETLDENALAGRQRGATLLAVDAALVRFEALDPRAAKVVELKFFGGCTEEAIAHSLGVSIRTVSGDWRRARAWLNRELAG